MAPRPDAGPRVARSDHDFTIAIEPSAELLQFGPATKYYFESDLDVDKNSLPWTPPTTVNLTDIDVSFDSLLLFMIRLILAGLTAVLFVALAFAMLFAFVVLIAMYLGGR